MSEFGPEYAKWQEITIFDLLLEIKDVWREVLESSRKELKGLPADQAGEADELRGLIDYSKSRIMAIDKFNALLLMGKDVSRLGVMEGAAQ